MAGKRNKAAKQINQVKPALFNKRLFSGNDAENYGMPPEPADDGVSSHSDDGSSNGDADSKPRSPLQHDSDNDNNNSAEETLSDFSEDALANEIKDMNINLDLAEKATRPVSKMPKLAGLMVKGRKTYKIMIGEAIESIGDKKGSSLVALHKWIMANYENEKPDKLRTYMKRAIASGIADGTLFHPGDNTSLLKLSNAKGSAKKPPSKAGSTSPDQQKATKTALQPEKKRLRPKKRASLEMSKPALLKMKRDKARRKAKKSAAEENKENTSPPVHLLRKSTKRSNINKA